MTMAEAFNEWMRRYTEEPAAFEAEFQTVGAYLEEQNKGKEPQYGANCAGYLQKLMDSPPKKVKSKKRSK